MHAWVAENVGELFNTREGRLLAFEAALAQARREGVTRLEIGEDVWAVTLDDASAVEFGRKFQQLHQMVALEIEWIPQLGLSRHCPLAALERWLSPFLEHGIYRTLDLYGDEFAQPIETFKPLYRMAKTTGLRLKVHVGEWGTSR